MTTGQQVMDIDDILRDVDPQGRAIPADTREIQLLTRLWVAERSAPELLEWVCYLSLGGLGKRTQHERDAESKKSSLDICAVEKENMG